MLPTPFHIAGSIHSHYRGKQASGSDTACAARRNLNGDVKRGMQKCQALGKDKRLYW